MMENKELPFDEIAQPEPLEQPQDILTILDTKIASKWESIDANLDNSRLRANDLAEYHQLLADREAILIAREPQAQSSKLAISQVEDRGFRFEQERAIQPQTIGPRYDGFSSMDPFGKDGERMHRRRNTKR